MNVNLIRVSDFRNRVDWYGGGWLNGIIPQRVVSTCLSGLEIETPGLNKRSPRHDQGSSPDGRTGIFAWRSVSYTRMLNPILFLV